LVICVGASVSSLTGEIDLVQDRTRWMAPTFAVVSNHHPLAGGGWRQGINPSGFGPFPEAGGDRYKGGAAGSCWEAAGGALAEGAPSAQGFDAEHLQALQSTRQL
jgi:hypothetical protein